MKAKSLDDHFYYGLFRETETLRKLFDNLCEKFNHDEILLHISLETDIAKKVIVQWLRGETSPSSGIKNKVLSSLKYWIANQDSLPVNKKIVSIKNSVTETLEDDSGVDPHKLMCVKKKRVEIEFENQRKIDSFRSSKNIKFH